MTGKVQVVHLSPAGRGEQNIDAERRYACRLTCAGLDFRDLDRFPNLHRRDRRLDRGDAEIGERIHHAIGDAGRTADGAGFAAALGAERIGAAWRRTVQRHFDRRNVVGARDAVILIARGDELAFAAIGDAFVERLAYALRDAAMYLPRHKHRIDGDADVIDRRITDHARDTGVRIDLDLADMRTVRPARAVGLAFAVDGKPRAIFLFGDVEQADMLVGADNRERAVAILDILNGRFQHLRGLLACFRNQIGRRDNCGRTADEQRARADAAEADGQIGVALHDIDLVDGDAKRI